MGLFREKTAREKREDKEVKEAYRTSRHKTELEVATRRGKARAEFGEKVAKQIGGLLKEAGKARPTPRKILATKPMPTTLKKVKAKKRRLQKPRSKDPAKGWIY